MYRLYFDVTRPLQGTLADPLTQSGQLRIAKWENDPNRVYVVIQDKSEMIGMMYHDGGLIPAPPLPPSAPTLEERVADLEVRVAALEAGA